MTYLVARNPVDWRPFGDVNRSTGSTFPPRRGELLDVANFEEAYQAGCLPLDLGGDLKVRIAALHGYAALKMKAWADRSLYGDYKDAVDLALACFWYCTDTDVTDDLWTERGEDAAILRLEFDQDLAAVDQLGHNIASLLTPITDALFTDVHRFSTTLYLVEISARPGWHPGQQAVRADRNWCKCLPRRSLSTAEANRYSKADNRYYDVASEQFT